MSLLEVFRCVRPSDWPSLCGTEKDFNVFPHAASCLVTSQYLRTLDDKLKLSKNFSSCYTLVTSNCGTNPLCVSAPHGRPLPADLQLLSMINLSTYH